MSDQIDVSSTRPAPTDGIDPSVRVPNAVKAAAARSEEIMRQMAGGDQPPAGDPPADPVAPPAGDPPAAPPAEPKPNPKARQKPAEAQPPAEPATPPAGEIDWEARFNAMQGRFNKSNDDNRRLSETVSSLQNVIARMEAAPAAAPTPAELRPESLLSKEEIDAYGSEFLDVVGKKAREIAAAETKELRDQIAKLSKGVEATTQVTTRNARENMFATLDDQLPNWREVNTDQNFLAWLRLPDPYSGAIRQDLLNAAFEQNSTPRVAAFFQGFLTEEAAVAPARNDPPATPPAPRPKVPLEQFAAPGRAKSAAANGAPAEKPIIKRSEVTAFYAEVAAGKYRGRDEEKNRAEAQIFEAEREGRIR